MLFWFLVTWNVALAADPKLSKIVFPAEVKSRLKSFEPSGTIYLKDINRFLIVSDDTDKSDRPLLFLMAQDGKVDDAPVNIDGIKKMTDMESISQDAKGNVLVISSQGLNKKGKEKKGRNLMVRAERKNRTLTMKDSLELRGPLLEALQASSDPQLKKMRGQFASELDVESHFVRDGELYIGLKNPQPRPGLALILNLGSLEAIFAKKKINALKVWRSVDFHALSKEPDLLSEILPMGGDLWLSATTEKDPHSRLWLLNEKTDKLSLRRTFTGPRLEGMSEHPGGKEILLVFDQGAADALYSLEPLGK